jgi:hypothetical protein
LEAVPLTERLAILTLSTIESDPGATAAVRNLICVALVMAQQLSEEQQVLLARFLREEADLTL